MDGVALGRFWQVGVIVEIDVRGGIEFEIGSRLDLILVRSSPDLLEEKIEEVNRPGRVFECEAVMTRVDGFDRLFD